MQKIKVYSINILELPQSAVHPSMRHPYDDTATTSAKLTISGRLGQLGKSIAWLPTREMAERFLFYWMPQLQARWQTFKTEIVEEIASKDQLRWMNNSSEKAKIVLASGDQCRASTLKSKATTEAEVSRYLIAAQLSNQNYFYAGKVKGNNKFCTSNIDAKRYKTKAACERVMALIPLSGLDQVRIHVLTDEEALHLEEEMAQAKKTYWDFQPARKY